MTRKSFFIMLTLVILSITSYGMLKSREDADEQYLFQLADGEYIQTIDLKNPYGNFKFYQEDGNWIVEQQGKYSTNPEKMDIMISALSEIKIKRELEEDNQAYGLGQKEVEVSYVTNNGSKVRFVIGNQTMTQSDYYMQNIDDKSVYITSAETVAQLTGSIVAYRNKDVLTVDAKKIVNLKLTNQRQEVVSVYLGTDENWYMDYPYKVPARTIEIWEFLLDMNDWNFYGYVDSNNVSERELGLDGDGYVLELSDSNGNHQTISFGKTDGSVIVARNGKEDDIMLLYSSEIDFTALDPDKLLFVAPLKNPIDSIQSITVATETSSFTFDQSVATGRFSFNGKYIDEKLLYRFYSSLISLTASGGDENPNNVILDDAQMVITIYKTDQTETQLVLMPRDDNSYYMYFGGDTKITYYTSSEKIQRMITRMTDCIK